MFVTEAKTMIKAFEPDPINYPLRYPSEIIIGTGLKLRGKLNEVVSMCIQYEDLSTGVES